MGATRFCMLRMGDAAVAVRNLPFKIGAGEDADMVWGGMSCEIETSDRGCELLTVSGAGAMVNGKAMGEGDRWALFNGDVVAMAAGGLQFVVEDIRVEASASALPPPERGVRESGGAGAFQALELAMEKALECIICHETMHRATSLIPCLHTMCAACASKCLAGNDACPTCRVPVTATGLAFTVNEAVDALHAATPGRKRPADDLLNMDRDAESLERHVERIVRQRERIVRQRLGDSLLDLVRGGDVAAVQDAIDDGGDIDERVEGVGSLLHVAVDAENLAMVDALIEREVDLEMDGPLGTAANLAANRGLVGILLSLLDAGADAEQIDDLSQGQFLLMRATRLGLVDAVRALVDAGVDPSEVGVTPLWEMRYDQPLLIEQGVFPLLEAARQGLPDVVVALIAAGAEPNQATTLFDRCGDAQKDVTALLVACELGHMETVEELLEGGADPALTDAMGGFPLILAAENGDEEITQVLLSAGADGNQAGKWEQDWTALMEAAGGGHVEVVRALLDHGVDVHKENIFGRTALFAACGCDPEQLERHAEEMTSRGTGHYVPMDRRPREVVRLLLAAGARVGGGDSKGECALMSVTGDVERVRMMMAAGADANQADEVGWSVLMRCMKAQVAAVVSLVGCRAESSFDGDAEEGGLARKKAASVAALWGKHLEVVRELLSNGADVRGTPVLLSSLQGYIELQKRLECGGFLPYGEPHPVRAAALEGLWAVQRVIMAAGALPPCSSDHRYVPSGRVFDSIPDEEPMGGGGRAPSPPRVHRPSVMQTDERGDTALHLASQAGHTDAVRAMVGASGGALVDQGNHQGGTALMAASSGGHVASVRALLAGGAGVGVVDAEGHGALWWAHGRWEVVRELVGAGADEASKAVALARAVQHRWDEVAQVLRGEEVVRDSFSGLGV